MSEPAPSVLVTIEETEDKDSETSSGTQVTVTSEPDAGEPVYVVPAGHLEKQNSQGWHSSDVVCFHCSLSFSWCFGVLCSY